MALASRTGSAEVRAILRRTFVMIPGIGPRTERKLWAAGTRDWKDGTGPLASGLGQRMNRAIAQAEAALLARDARYFCHCLPASEQWRICGEFRDQIAFLDIETTGLSSRRHRVTVIGLADSQGKVSTFVQGENLDQFRQVVDQYPVVVTYNGKQFDMPFLEQQIGWRPQAAHIDLRFGLSALGYRGGLKAVQSRLGILRPEQVSDLDGRAAVWLWHRYSATGDPAYRDLLVHYCLTDVIALIPLLAFLYQQRTAMTPFPDQLTLSVPPIKAPDRLACQRVIGEYWGGVNRQTTAIQEGFPGLS